MVCDFGDDHRNRHAKRDIGQGHQVHGQAAFLERAEESRPDLQAHGHHKENEAELLDDVKHVVVERNAAGTQRDAHKKHPSDAQRHIGNLDFAQKQADKDGNGQIQNGRPDARAGEKV